MKERLIGTWKLVSATREEIPSGAIVEQGGDSPAGYINYAPDGRMIAIIAYGGRPAPAGPLATAHEADALIKSMVAYAGTYTLEGDTVTHHVDISWNESWTGTKQARIFRFEGERLHLTTPPSPDPSGGKMSVRRMVWEKMATTS
jgi:Lipocalin-like domain